MQLLKNISYEEVDLLPNPEQVFARMGHQLFEFAKQFYSFVSYSWFQENILATHLPGNLVLYRVDGVLVGFTRLARRIVEVDHIQYAVHYGGTYHNPAIDIHITASRICLILALKYKLFQPSLQLIYLANAYLPQRYDYIRELSNNIEPQENGKCSRVVIELMKKICQLNHWQYHEKCPLLIKGLVPLKPIWRQHTPTNHEIYQQLNPNFMDGDSLFIYLPLDVGTLGRCLNRSIIDSGFSGGIIEHA